MPHLQTVSPQMSPSSQPGQTGAEGLFVKWCAFFHTACMVLLYQKLLKNQSIRGLFTALLQLRSGLFDPRWAKSAFNFS